jgi:hypothetical protein
MAVLTIQGAAATFSRSITFFAARSMIWPIGRRLHFSVLPDGDSAYDGAEQYPDQDIE